MENSSVKKFSAYTRICQKFLAACDEEGVSVGEAFTALYGFFKPQLPEEVRAPSASSNPSTPAKTATAALTREEVEEAKKVARRDKAKKFGLKESEVNLTPAEAREAKAAFREMKAKGNIPLASPKASKEEVKPHPSSAPKAPSQSTEAPKISEPERGVKTGTRATAKTKLDNVRRLCLRSNPAALETPCGLHMVAYANHFSRLKSQWDAYRSQYADTNMLSPLRGLPNPTKPGLINDYFQDLVKGLRQQSDSSGTFVLQDENGGSYWDKDEPSEHCPADLRRSIPVDVLGALSTLVEQ